MSEEAWRDQALCLERSQEYWFPPESAPKDEWRLYYDVARLVCDICPVRSQCAKIGADEVHGVFGGQLPVDRKAGRETPRPRKAITEADVMLLVPKQGRPHQDVQVVRQNLLDVAQTRLKKKDSS